MTVLRDLIAVLKISVIVLSKDIACKQGFSDVIVIGLWLLPASPHCLHDEFNVIWSSCLTSNADDAINVTFILFAIKELESKQ